MVHPEGSPSVVVDAQDRAPSKTRTPVQKLIDEPDWSPYCLKCSTMARMTRTPYGFVCDPLFVEAPLIIGSVVLPGRRGCGNTIGVDMLHIDSVEIAALLAPLEGVHDVKEPGSASCTENPLEAP